FSNPFVLVVTAVLALAIRLLPGFPLIVFLLIALALGALYVRRDWRKPGEPAREGGLVGKVAGAHSGGGAAKAAAGGAGDVDIDK
ncbi:EscV/YscV/HrcV family type III secretion system export apparatus protein, partial [Burkholderia pseudomallei]